VQGTRCANGPHDLGSAYLVTSLGRVCANCYLSLHGVSSVAGAGVVAGDVKRGTNARTRLTSSAFAFSGKR